MPKKIFNQTAQKVPFMLLAGERDVEAGAVSFRFRDGTQVNGVAVTAAVEAISEWISSRNNASPTAALFTSTAADTDTNRDRHDRSGVS